ncbi:MAG: hypothetical protein NT022_02620 [Deltaproteobacteria bacterium]|nr:hypothetical protein [Deltaproteobacteria bacterium]
MAEIKSTLDLIMERTKNLTMTVDEKKALRRKEWEGRVKGWVQKYIDGMMPLEDLKIQIESCRLKFQDLPGIIKAEVAQHIHPESNNAPLLQLLEEALDTPAEPIVDLITRFQDTLNTNMISRRDAIKQALEQKKVYGSSVIPNVDHDREWQEYVQNVRAGFREQVSSLIEN